MGTNHKTYLLNFLNDMRPLSHEVQPSLKPIEFSEIIAEIEGSRDNVPIIQLFEQAGSDFRDLRAWFAMVGLFADQLLLEKNGGRPKTWHRPSNEILRRDFTSCVRRNLSRNGKLIVEKMKELHPKRYAAPTTTILRWLQLSKISIKEVKKSIRDSRGRKANMQKPARGIA